MKKVYHMPIDSRVGANEISASARCLFERAVAEENITFGETVPLKVHFGEKGNTTFITSQYFQGIIDNLKEHGINSWFVDTNALYRGERTTGDKHIALAKAHGFTQIPVVIADGDFGDECIEVPIDKKHFKSCKIGKEIAALKQMIVVSHFKGHMLAGFGGAIKQLAMGCASRGGKLAQHAGSKPFINPFTCKQCMTCTTHCPVDALSIGRFSRIRRNLCIGCASCSAVCPAGAVLFNPLASLSRSFPEKVAEYAYAAQLNKTIVYVSFGLNITRGCDCEAMTASHRS